MVARVLAASALCAACGRNLPHDVPRTLGGTTMRGAFVPPGSYEAYVRGELLLAEGRPAQAVAQFDLASTAPEEDPYLLSRLAHAELRAGRVDDAARTLAHASELDACSEPVWLVRGELAEQQGNVSAARAAFVKASSCAPGSQEGALALSALLARRGDAAESLDVLVEASERDPDGRALRKLDKSLREVDGATLAYALAGLGAQRAADADAITRAIELALARGLPRLALRLRERHLARLAPALEAELLRANGMREELATLLAQHDAAAFGGSSATAALALEAGAYERAELEASSALASAPSDALHALRARALIALGNPRAATSEARAIAALPLRISVIGEALAALGAPALGDELARAR